MGRSLGATQTTVFTTDVLPALNSAKASELRRRAHRWRSESRSPTPNAAAQNAAYNAIYTPESPHYHHFMTAAQVAADFGVPKSTFEQLKAWATRDGLKVAFSPNTNEYMLLEGTAAAAEKTFSVRLEDYKQGRRRSTPTPPDRRFPPAWASRGSSGSTTFSRRTPIRPLRRERCVGLTTPQDLWSIYGQPTNIKSKTQDFGQGQSMAVLGEGAVSGVISDLRAFETEHQLPQHPDQRRLGRRRLPGHLGKR